MVFSNAVYYALRLLRDSDSTIFIGDENPSATSQNRASFGSYDSSYVIADTIAQSFLDSPNTTSPVTYKVDFRPYQHTATTSYINRSASDRDNADYDERSISVMTLQEIAE